MLKKFPPAADYILLSIVSVYKCFPLPRPETKRFFDNIVQLYAYLYYRSGGQPVPTEPNTVAREGPTKNELCGPPESKVARPHIIEIIMHVHLKIRLNLMNF